MKKVIACVAVLFLLVACSGCMESSQNDLSRRVVLQGIGIDHEENGYLLTLQVFNLVQAGASGTEGESNVTTIYEVRGDSISEAMQNMTRFVGKKPMYSHNRIIVIGQDVAKAGLRDVMDFFVRDYATRPSVDIAISKGKASEIIKAEFGKSSIPAEEIKRVLTAGRFNGKSNQTRVLDVMDAIESTGMAVTIPAVELVQNEPKDSSSVSVSGTALFHDDKLAGYLNEEETRAMMFLENKIKKGVFIVSVPNVGKVSLYVIDSKPRLKTWMENGAPKFHATVKITCDVNEIDKEAEKNQVLDISMLEEISDDVEQKLANEMNSMLKKAVQEMGCDVLCLGRRVMQKAPAYFRTVEQEWDRHLKEMDMQVDVEVIVRRTGHEGVHFED